MRQRHDGGLNPASRVRRRNWRIVSTGDGHRRARRRLSPCVHGRRDERTKHRRRRPSPRRQRPLPPPHPRRRPRQSNSDPRRRGSTAARRRRGNSVLLRRRMTATLIPRRRRNRRPLPEPTLRSRIPSSGPELLLELRLRASRPPDRRRRRPKATPVQSLHSHLKSHLRSRDLLRRRRSRPAEIRDTGRRRIQLP